MLRPRALMTALLVGVMGLYFLPQGLCWTQPPNPNLAASVYDQANKLAATAGVYVYDMGNGGQDNNLQVGDSYPYVITVDIPYGVSLQNASIGVYFHRHQVMGSAPGDGSAPTGAPDNWQGFSCTWAEGSENHQPPPCVTAQAYWDTSATWTDINSDFEDKDLYLYSEGNFTPEPGLNTNGQPCDCAINWFAVTIGIDTNLGSASAGGGTASWVYVQQ